MAGPAHADGRAPRSGNPEMPLSPIVAEDLANIARADIDWDRLAGATVLVSGANGFLPAYIVETLLHLNDTRPGFGAKVLALVRSRERALARFPRAAGRSDISFLVKDELGRASCRERVGQYG